MRSFGAQGRLLAVAVSIAAGACTPGIPDRPSALDIAVPADWQAATAPDGAPPAGWLEELGSPTLTDFVSEALIANRDLQAAVARREQALAQARIAGADRWPDLSVQGRVSRIQNRFTGPTGETDSVRQSNYSLLANASWEADLWGRLAARDAAGGAELLASEADFEAARLSLGGQVAQGWFNLITARQRLALARATVESFERTLSIVRGRYNRGITTALDVRLAASNLASAESLAARRQSEVEAAARALELLLGRYPAAALEAALELPEPAIDVPAGVPSGLLVRRPDIAAAQARLIAADYRVAEARRSLLPQITLSGNVGQQTESASRFLDFDSIVYQLVAGLTQPVFQGGRLRANVKLEKARRDERIANYAATLLDAFEEVENALADEIYLAEQQALTAEAAEQAAAAEELAEQQYARGIAPILNLLDAQRRNLDAQGQLLDTRLARLNNRVRLYVALGGELRPREEMAQAVTP